MRNISRAVALAAALSVGACGLVPNRNSPEFASATPPASEGTIILSTGAAERCFQASTFLSVAPLGSGFERDVVENLGVDVWVAKSDFDDHQGNIHALNLPAGEYQMYPWLAGNFVPIHVHFAPFKVEPGKTIYLGEFYMTTSCGISTEGEFHDRQDRDIALLQQKNPAFASVVIEKHIAQFTGLIVDKPQ